jgi:hypothetical protein
VIHQAIAHIWIVAGRDGDRRAVSAWYGSAFEYHFALALATTVVVLTLLCVAVLHSRSATVLRAVQGSSLMAVLALLALEVASTLEFEGAAVQLGGVMCSACLVLAACEVERCRLGGAVHAPSSTVPGDRAAADQRSSSAKQGHACRVLALLAVAMTWPVWRWWVANVHWEVLIRLSYPTTRFGYGSWSERAEWSGWEGGLAIGIVAGLGGAVMWGSVRWLVRAVQVVMFMPVALVAWDGLVNSLGTQDPRLAFGMVVVALMFFVPVGVEALIGASATGLRRDDGSRSGDAAGAGRS